MSFPGLPRLKIVCASGSLDAAISEASFCPGLREHDSELTIGNDELSLTLRGEVAIAFAKTYTPYLLPEGLSQCA